MNLVGFVHYLKEGIRSQNRTFKKIAISLSILSFLFLSRVGVIFTHWPFASVNNIATYLAFAVTIPILTSQTIKTSLVYPLSIISSIITIGFLFKTMDWPYAEFMIIGGLLSLPLLYTIRYLHKKDKSSIDHLKLIMLFIYCIGEVFLSMHWITVESRIFKQLFTPVALSILFHLYLLGVKRQEDHIYELKKSQNIGTLQV